MSIAVVHDSIHANIAHLPKGPAAGYTTGSPDIRWTGADWAAHPGAVRIDQDTGAQDDTADALDVERGAATNAEAAGWFKRALASFDSAKRPGQRSPAIYTSASNVTPLVNALLAGGVRSGVGLWVAEWALGEATASQEVQDAAGPFPIIGVQYASNDFYDTDVFDGAWLADVSGTGPVRHITDGKTTLTGYAAARGMHAGSWLALQQKLGGKDAADALGAAAPRAGLPWYSATP